MAQTTYTDCVQVCAGEATIVTVQPVPCGVGLLVIMNGPFAALKWDVAPPPPLARLPAGQPVEWLLNVTFVADELVATLS